MMYIHKRSIFWAMICLLTLSLNVSAESLVFGVLEDIPPYQYQENEELKGIDIDIGKELSKRIGFDIIYKVLPWTRIKKYAAEGKIDGIISMYCLERYLEILDFAESVLTSKISIFALKDRNLKIDRLADLKGKTVGVIRGYTYSPEFNAYRDFKRAECDDDTMLVTILEKGRVEIAVAEEIPFRFISKKLGLQNKFEELYMITETKICIGFSKKALGPKSKVLADKTTKIFLDLEAEGIMQNILNKYLK